MDENILNVCLIGCGFFLGMMFMDIISAHSGDFNANTIRKINKRIYDIKKLIRKTNKQIKRYVKSDSCPTQYYRIDWAAIPRAYIDKFQLYYTDRGFKVWIDDKLNALYISWEEDGVSSSNNNK